MFQPAFNIEDDVKLKEFVGTLSVREEDFDTTVKSKVKSIIITTRKLVQIPRKADICLVERRRPMIFLQYKIQLPRKLIVVTQF